MEMDGIVLSLHGGRDHAGGTTRGMKENDMSQIAAWIDRLITDIENESTITKVKDEVNECMKAFPLYGE